MAPTNNDVEERYFSEVTLQLRKAGFTIPDAPQNNLLSVEWNGRPLCQVTSTGGTRYRASDVRLPDAEAACANVFKIASTTAEYMKQMEDVPPLHAEGLSGDYRILADFNGTVLAGHPTQSGVEFVTWDWSFDRQGLCHGHYFACDGYETAKQDFASRSNLVPKDALFTQEQFLDIHQAVSFYREMNEDILCKENQRLNELLEHIERLLPNMEQQPQDTLGMQMGGIQ